ncbi:Uncharacterised protein [Mycobacterium tuberculosis]|nr:Uncharacterised protein [Mycobacterium tuberculosis]
MLFPAPFGPIIDVIAFRENSAEILLRATNFPNDLLTPVVRRITCEDVSTDVIY